MDSESGGFFPILYGCMALVGTISNGYLWLTLISNNGARSRNPLLYGLVFSDLMVSMVALPLTGARYYFPPFEDFWIAVCNFIQDWAVMASTVSMMTISIDRYLTVCEYRSTFQVQHKWFNVLFTILAIWVWAGLLSTSELVGTTSWGYNVAVARMFLGYLIPGFAVIASHVGVYRQLTSASLVSRVQHGDLALPMPMIRKSTHVIIVSGVIMGEVVTTETGETGETTDAEGQTEPSKDTLKYRRNVGHTLLGVALLFVFIWLPYVIIDCLTLCGYKVSSTLIRRGCLLLGHLHSVISPIIYYSMNKQWLELSLSCRMRPIYRSASSTNEAALGPFQPKYVRPPPPRRRSSSYLY